MGKRNKEDEMVNRNLGIRMHSGQSGNKANRVGKKVIFSYLKCCNKMKLED